MSHSPTLSCGLRKECCQFTIENWSSFRSQAWARIRGWSLRVPCTSRLRLSTCAVGGYGILLLHGARLPRFPSYDCLVK
ncbi:hypothetical protein MRX96_038111 [Rhipicephalus microplus]